MQCTYKRDIEARSRNHYCRGKAISITHSQCASVALVIQHAMRMRRKKSTYDYIAISGLSGSTIFLYIISVTSQLSKKKVTEYKTCVSSLQICLKHFSF
jgi:hypothetical protein